MGGSMLSMTSQSSATGLGWLNAQTASAIFDTQAEAQRAVAELRDAFSRKEFA